MTEHTQIPIFPDHIELGLTLLSPLELIDWELEKLELEEIYLLEEHYYRQQELIYRDQMLKLGLDYPGDYIY